MPVYLVVDAGDEHALRAEARRQLGRFRRLCGADPTHLDSHQHVHRDEPCATVLHDLGAELAIPVRERSPGIRYRGDFYGQSGDGYPLPDAITTAALISIIESLDDGVTELGCHPAQDRSVESDYGVERVLELQSLCDPLVRRVLQGAGVTLLSFAQLRDRPGSGSRSNAG
jgi:predicted glycoside hydrolase/deacetylase ChbG (UPF0249 family)